MAFERGTHFAGHCIVRLLGTGCDAEVYEVIAAEGRRRALKIIKRGVLLSAKPQARLGLEGEVVASIEDVHVVRYYDSGVEDDRVWLLMELVEGPDLRRLLQETGGALPPERAVSIVRQACLGVAAAHALGIQHRDLKPENILVAADDFAKVADFGAAKVEDVDMKTTNPQEVGSWLYRAPERFKGNKSELRSDVYAMGVVLYEAVAGVHPLVPRPLAPIDICRAHILHHPPPLATLGLDLPGDLSDLVERAMAKDPAHRPSMHQLAEALGGVLHRLNTPRRALARGVPLPNQEIGRATTEPAMTAFGAGGTLRMDALPEALASDRGPTTRRSSAATLVEERASTTAPVERAAPPPSRSPRSARAALAGVAVLVLFAVAAGWALLGAGGAAPVSAAPRATALPSGSSSAKAPPRRPVTPKREKPPF